MSTIVKSQWPRKRGFGHQIALVTAFFTIEINVGKILFVLISRTNGKKGLFLSPKKAWISMVFWVYNLMVKLGFRPISSLNMLKIAFTNPRFCAVTKTWPLFFWTPYFGGTGLNGNADILSLNRVFGFSPRRKNLFVFRYIFRWPFPSVSPF